MTRKFAIIDVETTGGTPSDSKITELAVFIYDGKKIIDEFSSLINPERKIDPFVVRLTRINDKMVRNAPKFCEISQKLLEITKDCVFVAHNVHFDYDIIKREFRALGLDFRRPYLCTVSSSKKIIPGHDSYSLGKLSKSLNINIDGRHRAGGDALATVKLFEILYHKNQNLLDSLIQEELNLKNLHPKLNIEMVDGLPNLAGIFSFYDESNRLIFINKSKQIKNDVFKMLRSKASEKWLKVQPEVARIELELTGTDLIAQLLFLRQSKSAKFNVTKKKENFPYGIFRDKKDVFYCDEIAQQKVVPICSFSSLNEAKKELEKIHNSSQSLAEISTLFSLPFKQFFIFGKGRNRTEKSVVCVANDTLVAYGFLHFTEIKKSADFIKSKLIALSEHKDDYATIQEYLNKNLKVRIQAIH